MYANPMYAISMYAKIWKHCNWCKELEFTSPYKQLSGVIKNKKKIKELEFTSPYEHSRIQL